MNLKIGLSVWGENKIYFSIFFRTKAGRGTAWNKFPVNLNNLEFFACTGRTAENLPIFI